MRYWRIFIIPCVLLFASCGGGSVFSGFGNDFDEEIAESVNENLCEDARAALGSWTGTWEGTGVSNKGASGGFISLSMSHDDDCDISGAVVFQPCVPVTPVSGSGAMGFVARTTDGSLVVDSVLGTTPDELISVGTQQEVEYTFENTQNVPNCPQSDTGTALLTKTS